MQQQEFSASHLDLRVFARSAGQLAGKEGLDRYGRVAQESQGWVHHAVVDWSARGEMRVDHLGQEEIWLHLHADVLVPMTCQRCLEMVEMPLRVERRFRFVADEETAAAQDDDVQEDLLVLAGDFNLHQLIEDELVLELPLIARHEICPAPPPSVASDSEFGISVAGRSNPFAVLARLKPGQGDGTA